jgi:hypothetical protein
MFVNIFWVRVTFIAIPLLAMLGFLMSGGRFGGKSSIVVEYGIEASLFEGSEVEIDGQVVGTLKRFGNANRTAFAVPDGKHTVKVLHPEFNCRPVTVNSGAGARTVHLILDFVTSSDPDAAPMIGFMY